MRSSIRTCCGTPDTPSSAATVSFPARRSRSWSPASRSDASPAMLAEAQHPFNEERITAQRVTLVEADLFAHDFEPGRFDFVYSIGVLAEHVPFDATVAAHVSRWLKAGGIFAFSTVHPES